MDLIAAYFRRVRVRELWNRASEFVCLTMKHVLNFAVKIWDRQMVELISFVQPFADK